MNSRREQLENITLKVVSSPHPGLWLDKFLQEQEPQGGEGTFSNHFRDVAGIPVMPEYKAFFEGWKRALDDGSVATKEAKTLGRLVIGLGAESVLETSIAIHRTYGVPYIPGSALKGLAARYARMRLGDEWDVEGKAYRILFGDTTTAGYVTFFDAFYIPGSVNDDKPLVIDVITVHHPDYYQGKHSPPADWDSPNPVPLLSTTGSYLIALHGPDEWVDAALRILALALRTEGIGAKTSSGYGRMVLKDVEDGEDNVEVETYALAKVRLLKKETPPPERYRGEVVKVLERYGFINPAKGGSEVFVHQNQLRSGDTVLRVGQIVEYRIGQYKGKPQAQEVDVLLNSES